MIISNWKKLLVFKVHAKIYRLKGKGLTDDLSLCRCFWRRYLVFTPIHEVDEIYLFSMASKHYIQVIICQIAENLYLSICQSGNSMIHYI